MQEAEANAHPGNTYVSNVLPDSPTAAQLGPIAVTGRSIVATTTGGGSVVVYRRDGSATVIATCTLTGGPGTVRSIASNGIYVAVAWDTFLEVFNHDTGASLFKYDHTADVNACALGPDTAYLGGNDTFAAAVRSLSISGGGTVNWSYDHSADVESIAVSGRHLFLYGAASSHGSAATLRAIDSATGRDAAGEGGIGTSTRPDTWDATPAAPVSTHPAGLADRLLATDGDAVWVSQGSGGGGGAGFLEERSAVDGTVVATITANEEVQAIAVDQDYVYVGTSDETGAATNVGDLVAYRKGTLAAAWLWRSGDAGGTGASGVLRVEADGSSVFALRNVASGAERSPRIAKGNRPQLYQLVDPNVQSVPFDLRVLPGSR